MTRRDNDFRRGFRTGLCDTGAAMRDDVESVQALLVNLGQKRESFRVIEVLSIDTELEQKFQALEALSEMERPRTIRACVEVLRIFKE
jgi:hypothetical protein